MTLNIKDPEAHRLAKAISEMTRDTMTQVGTEALRQRYEELNSRRDKATVQELLAIARRAKGRHKGPFRDHSDYLYDDRGLPITA